MDNRIRLSYGYEYVVQRLSGIRLKALDSNHIRSLHKAHATTMTERLDPANSQPQEQATQFDGWRIKEVDS